MSHMRSIPFLLVAAVAFSAETVTTPIENDQVKGPFAGLAVIVRKEMPGRTLVNLDQMYIRNRQSPTLLSY